MCALLTSEVSMEQNTTERQFIDQCIANQNAKLQERTPTLTIEDQVTFSIEELKISHEKLINFAKNFFVGSLIFAIVFSTALIIFKNMVHDVSHQKDLALQHQLQFSSSNNGEN